MSHHVGAGELNLVLLKEQPVLITVKSSLQSSWPIILTEKVDLEG